MIIARVIAVLVVVTMLLFPAAVPRAGACTCAPLPRDRETMQEYLSFPEMDSLIVGKLVATSPGRAVVAPERVYWGTSERTYDVALENSCDGVRIGFGRPAVLFLMRSPGSDEVRADSCISAFADSKNAIAFLAVADAMFPQPPPPPLKPAGSDEDGWGGWWLSGVGALLVLSVGATIVAWKRRAARDERA